MRTVPEAHAAVGAYRAGLVPPVRGDARVDLRAAEPLLGDAPPAEVAAAAHAERLRGEVDAVLAVAPGAVWVLDASGGIVRTSAATAALVGEAPRTLAELWERDQPRRPGRGGAVPVPLEEHPAMRALRGETVRGELLLVRRDGDRLVETHAGPVRDAAGCPCGAVVVDRDVSDRARLTQALDEQTQRTRERRLAAVGQLAAGVMHDVNNALNPIIAAAYLLQRHADDPARVRDYAERIAKAAETGAATASRVGRFIRQEPVADDGLRDPVVDLAALAEEVLALAGATWAGGHGGGSAPVTAVRRLAPGATACGVAGEIREALLNLVQNAVDAMPAGGRLTVATGVDGEGAMAESWVEVRDTGVGMSEEVRDRALEPFFTTKGSGGSGLGLAEVYGIMRRHRGRVELESAPAAGTSVRLVFPYAAAERPRPRPLPVGFRARGVLVVEDDPDGREFLHALLTSEGHTVDTAGGVWEARALLALGDAGEESAELPYDVLLTDVGLPDGDGRELVREARARWPRLRIGVVTGWEGTPLPGLGDDRTLRKPLRADELLAFVAAEHPEPSRTT